MTANEPFVSVSTGTSNSSDAHLTKLRENRVCGGVSITCLFCAHTQNIVFGAFSECLLACGYKGKLIDKVCEKVRKIRKKKMYFQKKLSKLTH